MIIRYSTFALADLDIIYAHISEDNDVAALKVKYKIQRTIDSLAELPHRGHSLASKPEIYKLTVSQLPYVIYYEVHEHEVWVIRIFHHAQARLQT